MRIVSIIVVSAILLGGLFVLMKPVTPAPEATAPRTTAPDQRRDVDSPLDVDAQAIEATAEPDVIGVEITDGHRSAGPDVVRVFEGEAVRMVFVSNTDTELHLHGYDITLDLAAERPATLSFTADRAGRFEYELHGGGGHGAIGVLEVQPR